MLSQRSGTAKAISNLDGQAARIVLDLFDAAIQPDFLNQVVVFIVFKLITLTIFILQLAQSLGLVVMKAHRMAQGIDATGKQATPIALVVGAALILVDAGNDAAQGVIDKLLARPVCGHDFSNAPEGVALVVRGVA